MPGKIFINYRRSTDRASAGRLYDQLENVFGRADVFFDVDDIEAGSDFVQVLSDRVANCEVFLAVIGHNWINVLDEEGHQRISDHNDWVRVEIEAALQQGKRVIPVLVDGALMPRADKLPSELSSLARRQAVRVSHEQFRQDVQRLINQIMKFRTAEAERQQSEVRKLAENEQQQELPRKAAAEKRQQQETEGEAANNQPVLHVVKNLSKDKETVSRLPEAESEVNSSIGQIKVRPSQNKNNSKNFSFKPAAGALSVGPASGLVFATFITLLNADSYPFFQVFLFASLVFSVLIYLFIMTTDI